jgi:DNA polymerase
MNTKQKVLLEWLEQMGANEVYAKEPINRNTTSNSNTAAIPSLSIASKQEGGISRELANNARSLDELKIAVTQFEGLEIKKLALNTVFADGNPSAQIMFVGEAPGANEDKQGIPFCGQSGKLLDNIILAIGLKRPEVYITNTIFWRPPGNRRPTQEELNICRPFVEKHIALVNPKIIVLVGSTAVESLLGTKVPMHYLRDGMYEYTNNYLLAPIKTYVIFHPSYLLRQPSKKKLMWFDILKVKDYITSAG